MELKKYKATVFFAINNSEQFIWFKNCFEILLLKNNNSKNVIFRILLDPKQIELNENIKTFIWGSFNKINVEFISDTNKLFKNKIISKHPIIWWVFFPFISNDSEYILWIDNDTVPYLDINKSIDEITSNDVKKEYFIYQRPTNVDNQMVTKFKLKLIKAQRPKLDISIEKLGNGGFVLINYNRYIAELKKLNLNSIEKFRKYMNQFVKKNILKTFTTYLSDEVFYLTLFDKFIFNEIPLRLNYSQAALKEDFEKIIDEDNFMLHLFYRLEGKKFPIYKYFNEGQNIELLKDDFNAFMIEMSKTFKSNFSSEEISKFTNVVFEKLSQINK